MTQQIQSIPYPSYTTAQRDAMTASGYFSVGLKITNSTIGSKNIYNN